MAEHRQLGGNLIGQARNGSGNTTAYGLVMLLSATAGSVVALFNFTPPS